MSIKIAGVQLGNITGGPSSLNLSDLHDVSIVSPTTGEFLMFNSALGTSGEWQNSIINPEVYSYLSTNLLGTNGIVVTPLSGPSTLNLSLSVTASGDATGSVASGNLPLTLATVNTNVGQFSGITVNGKGLVTAAVPLTGDISTSGSVSLLATVNSNVGTFGSSSLIPIVTVNGKGLITAVSTTTFTGTAPLATSLAGGAAGNIVYQSGASTTAFLTTGTATQVLISGTTPSWTNAPTLTGTNFSGIPNVSLTNSSVTIGTTNISLGASSTTLVGLTSVTSTSFVGPLTGNATTATTLATARSISATGDAAWTVTFDGSSNVTAALTLATVNANIGQFAVATVNAKGLVTAATNLGVTGDVTGTSSAAALTLTLATVNGTPVSNSFQKVTTNGKGLVTATSAVTSSDITTALGFTPVNKAGDTMGGFLILNADPVSNLGAATKQYVDNAASGINVHQACETGSTAALPSCTYSNGTGGVGATLTATANGSLNSIGVGGDTTMSVGSRLLIKNQAAQIQNGIYVISTMGTAGTPWVLTRSSDFDGTPTTEVVAGDLTYVQLGTLGGTQWVQTSVGTGVNVTPEYNYVIIGTDVIVFSQFAGAGAYTAGSGINIASNAISNTGVLSNVAGAGITVSGATGNVTITNSGVTSLAAGANISVSAATGAITVAVTGTVSSATNLAGGAANSIPYQTGAGVTTFLAQGTGVLQETAGLPGWTTTPILTGTNFTGIPNTALSNNTITVNGTSIALGASATVTAAAGTLTGATLNPTVTTSSLTSVGTLGTVTVAGTITGLGSVSLTAANAGIEIGSTSSNNTPFIDMHSSGNNIDYDVRLIASGGSASVGQGVLSIQAANVSASQFTATTFNGTLSGSITGNAATVTNNSGRADSTAYPVLWSPPGGGGGEATFSCPAITITSSSGSLNASLFNGLQLNSAAGVASRIVVADGSGYINNTYFNGSDEGTNGTAGTVTAILTKRGDNYYRSTTPQSVMNYLMPTTNNWPYANSQAFLSGAAVGSSGNVGNLWAYAASGSGFAAGMSFHRAGSYAINFGMDTDNIVRMGGWSDGASTYRIQIDTVGNTTVRGGLYPSNGANYLRSSTGPYAGLEIVGTTGGYAGTSYNTSASGTHTMFDASGNGGDYDTTTGWHYYWNRSQTCLGIGGATTASGSRAYVNGNQTTGGYLLRSAHSNGMLVGGYNNIGPSEGKTNPIFCIGTAYVPTDTALSGMYGIGYSQTFGPSGYTGWGMYVSSGGVARVGLSSDSGTGYFAGDVIAYSSDKRLKTNVTVIENALDKVMKIRGVEYDWLDGIEESHDFHPTMKHETGVIAQEVQAVIPDAVYTAPFNKSYTEKHGVDENFLTVDKEKIVPLLIEAIKELNAKVESLMAQLAAKG